MTERANAGGRAFCARDIEPRFGGDSTTGGNVLRLAYRAVRPLAS
jgi:hypothetical protein